MACSALYLLSEVALEKPHVLKLQQQAGVSWNCEDGVVLLWSFCCCGVVVFLLLWCCGIFLVVVLWYFCCCGVVVFLLLWCCGVVVLWSFCCCGVVVFLLCFVMVFLLWLQVELQVGVVVVGLMMF